MEKAIEEKIDKLSKEIDQMSATELLQVDALLEAEKITGTSYKESDFTTSIGLRISVKVSDVKKKLLQSNKDTNFSTTIEEFEEILQFKKFEKIYSKTFVEKDYHYTYGNNKECIIDIESQLLVYWNYELNTLVECTTYHNINIVNDKVVIGPQTINSATMRYCIKAKDEDCKLNYTVRSSSCPTSVEGVRTGNHDIREGFVDSLNNLKMYYDFIEWVEPQFLWLIHYSETESENYDYKSLNETVIKQLPEKVKKQLGTKK